MNKIHNFIPLIFSHLFNTTPRQVRLLAGVFLLLSFGSSAFAATTCPSEQRMYYVGAAAPATAYKSQPLSGWVEGSLTRTYTFSETTGNKTLTINFPLFLDKYTIFSSQPPYYGSLNGATLNAITMIHNSTATKNNHIMDVTVNKPVAKFGYVIQDADSARDGSGNVPYQEAVNVSSTSGTLTFQPDFHTINPSLDMVTSILRIACSGNSSSYACPIEATWGPKAASSPFSMTHSNEFSQYNGAHVIGYSDFYFCLAPPKLTVRKALTGTRVNSNDQFEISVTGGSIAANSFTTTGTGSTITNGTSATLSLVESTSYTITERVMNGTTLGDIANYSATYTCNNATTGSSTVMPTTAMTYNATTKTRSFTLANTTFGDEITCTITNTPTTYTFSGIVFNDNGGITASDTTRQNISSTFIGNSSYFNGVYDSATESGIYDNNLSIRLTDCSGNNITTLSSNPQTVSSAQATIGRYNFIVSPSALANRTRVCLIEVEPSAWQYTVDTNTDTREVTLIADVYDYKTERNAAGAITRNLDFGEVQASNTALVLIKSQYVHECTDSLNYQNVADDNNPAVGFSINPISGVSPGKCIAYRIQAYNRGHVSLQQVQINDKLQTVPITSVFRRPAPLFLPTSVGSPTVVYDSNGEIQSNPFSLDATPSSNTQPNSATLYFNTKYGNIQ